MESHCFPDGAGHVILGNQTLFPDAVPGSGKQEAWGSVCHMRDFREANSVLRHSSGRGSIPSAGSARLRLQCANDFRKVNPISRRSTGKRRGSLHSAGLRRTTPFAAGFSALPAFLLHSWPRVWLALGTDPTLACHQVRRLLLAGCTTEDTLSEQELSMWDHGGAVRLGCIKG